MSAPLRQPPLKANVNVLDVASTKFPAPPVPFDEVAETYMRMKAELRAAARVQQSLLPKSSVTADGARFAWRFLPSSELGGDMFNVVQLDDSHVAVYLLDVVGHGACPALLAVTVSQLLSHMPVGSLLFEANGSDKTRSLPLAPARVAAHLNERFPMDSECHQYFTFLYGVLGLETGSFQYAAAGHPGPVLVRRRQGTELLPSTGTAVGWFPNATFRDHTVELEAGDRLYLYSDGVIEAESPGAEQFCARRLAQVAELSRETGLEESVDAVLQSVSRWCGGHAPADDVSLLGIEFEGRSQGPAAPF